MTVTTLGAFPGANSKDKSARIPAAIAALNKALAGDQQALTYMRQQAVGSATAVGKDAFKRALAIYDANKPAAAPASSATPTVGLVPVPRPPVLLAPREVPLVPLGLPTPPIPPEMGGVTVPVSQAKPVGFDNTHPPLTHAPSSTMTVTSLAPRKITPITIGSPDGGVVMGPPAPEYSGPESAAVAPANFGYVAPSSVQAAPTTAATTTPAPSNSKIILVLGALALLWVLSGKKQR